MTRLTERPYSRILALVLALLLALNTIPSGGFRTFAGEEGEGQEQGGGETPTGAVTDQTSATVKLFYQNDVPENVQLKAKGTVTFTNTVNEEDVKSVEIDDNGVITVEGFSDGASYQLSFGNTYLYDSANSLYISGVSDPIELNNNADIMVLCNVVGTKEYTGKVQEGTGESVLPVSGATVTVSAIGGRALPEAKAATTEADGSFTIALPILEGQAVSATVSKQYYETATPDPAWTIPAGTETDLGTITLSPVPDNTPPVISFATTARDGCFWAYDLWNQLWGKGDSSQIYFTVSDGTPQNENEPKSGPSKVYYCVGTVSTVDDLLAKDDKVTVDIDATNGVCTFAATGGMSYSFFAEDKAGKRTGLYTVTCKADASDPYISTVALFSDEQCSSNQGIEEKANGYASNETMYLKLIAQDTGAGLRSVSLYTKLTGSSDAYALHGTFAPTSQNELIIPLTATEFSVLTDLAIVVEDLVGNKQGSDTNPVSISNLNAGLSKDAVIISGGRAKISVTVSPTPRVIPAVTGTPEEPAQQSVPERVVFGTFPAYTFELTDTSVDEQSRKIKDITVIVNGTPISVKLKGTEDTIDNTQEYPSPVEFDVVNPTIPDPTDNTKTISLFVEGENKIEVSCKNHLGLQTTEEYTFYLQTTQPAITGVQIAPVNGTSMRIDGDTVYANGPLSLTVSMDNIAYLCGETVSLYNDGEEAAIASGAVGENNSVTLTIPYASGENVTLNLSVKAVDAFGRESACTFTTDGNFSNMSSGKILLSDAEPSVSINVGTPDYTDGNGMKWYKTEPTTTVTVTSEFIKIHSVVISVNGTPVEEFTASEQNPSTGNYSKQLSLSGNNVYNEHVIKVTATDNTGVEITVTDAIYIDRAAPATPALSIAAANGAPVNLVDGVYYANGEVSFTASATDAQTAVNVIKLFEKDDASGNETEITGTKNQDGTYTFNIALSSSKTRKFLARAYDMVGRSSDSSTFTVTMEKTAPVISATLTGDPKGRTVGSGEDARTWYSDNVTWQVELSDSDSGIGSYKIKLNGTELNADSAGNTLPSVGGSFVPSISVSISTAQVAANTDCSYTLEIEATDNAGNKSTTKRTVYIDGTLPIVTAFEVIKANEAGTLNSLDFGTFGNGPIIVKVTAQDPAGNTPASGVKTVILYVNDTEFDRTEIPAGQNTVTCTYTIPKDVASSFSMDVEISAEVIDWSNNQGTTKLTKANSNLESEKILLENAAPTVSVSVTEPGTTTVSDGKTWHSSDVTWNVQVEDGDSGIGSYQIKLNGAVLDKDSANKALPPVSGSKVPSISVSISTAQVTANTDCSYTLEVVATDNAGNQSTVWTETVYIDGTLPIVTAFEVIKANEAGTLNSLDFGTFGNGPIIVKVTAQDPAGNTPASGVKTVILYVNDTEFDRTEIPAGQNTVTCTYTLPKDLAACFAEDVKISAVVVDRSGGKSGAPTELTADNSNLESGEILLENTAPAFSAKIIGNPEFRTVGNGENERKWYSSDVTWQVEIKDAESGIYSYQIRLNGNLLESAANGQGISVMDRNSKKTEIIVPISTVQAAANADCSYTIEVVATDNAGNQSAVWTETVYIDSEAPVVTGFEVKKANEADSLTSTKFGTFGNGPITVKVTVQDPAGDNPASGIATVILYVNGEKFEETAIDAGQDTATCTYTIPKDVAASLATGLKISAMVTDRSGKPGALTELTATNSNLDSGVILLENNVPTVSVGVDESVVTPVVRDGKTWYSSDVMWNINIEDADSGIGSYQIKLNGNLLSFGADGNPVSSVSEDEKETIVSVPVSSLQAAANADCSFTIEVVATDNAGNVSETVTQTVHIDAVRPVVTGFEVTKAYEADSLTSLDFGTFGNGPLTVNVTVQDPAGDAPASGIESVILYVNGELFEATAIAAGQNTVTCTYTVPKELAANFATGVKISAQATDRSGNWGTVTELTPSNSNLKSGQILLENNRPTASIAVTVPGGNSVVRDGMEWYSADTLWDISVSDADTGIANVTVTVNGNPVMTDRNGVNISDLFAGSEPVKEAVVSISSVNFETSYDASYTLSVTVTDLAGNVSETVTRQIYRDSQAPSITGFRYFVNGEERMQEATPDQSGYGVFSMNGITVVISAFEPLPGAGLKSITYVLEDTETGRTEERAADVNESGEIAVTINAPFKGRIYAMATDYATNGGTYSMSAGLIIEAGETHNNEQHIAIEKAATEFRQANGTELYNGNVELTVRVSDAVSGIRSIEWSVVAPFDQGKNQNGVLTVGADGSLAGDAGWVAEATDANLATELRKTFVISHDSNDIVFRVKITDRAGHQTERTVTFGIDKTAPSVEYFFDNKTGDPDHPTVFNDIRTMTIVVTERNFTGTDFICDIKNPGGGVPTISLWTEERDSVDPNKSTYTATVAFNFDGNFTVNLGYMDRAGNRAAIAAPTTEFAIDRAKPVVSIVYDGRSAYSENYYKEPRTAIVKVIERNFDVARVSFSGNATKTGSWVANGDEHTLTVEFNDDGEYRFGVSVTDRAGNVSLPYTDDTFIIDTAAPTLTLEGIADANRGEVAPVITVTDRNFRAAGIKITITKSDGTVVTRTYSTEEFVDGDDFGIRVRFKNFDPMKENDDIYTMSVSAIDLAGNRSEEIVRTFSVNRFGSTYDMTGVEDRSGIFTSMPKDIVFTEINVDDIERDSVEIYVIRNSVPKKLTKDTDFFVEEITEPGADWKAYRYTIKSNTFSEDGEYSIRVVSKDKAGNINENDENGKNGDITFCVDRVAPNVIVISPEDEKSYVQNSLAASIEVRDNYKLDTVMIFLNDKEVSYTRNGNMFTFTVPQDDTKQTLRVVAVDAAGNTSVVEVKDFLVSTNMFIRFINNPAAVIAAIIALLALIGGTIFFVIIKRRRYA